MPASAYGHANCPCRLLDLRTAAEFFRHEIAGVGDADAQTLASNAVASATCDIAVRAKTVICGLSTPSVPPDITKRDLLFDIMRKQINMRRERDAQRGHRVFSRKVIYSAIALGLSRLPVIDAGSIFPVR